MKKTKRFGKRVAKKLSAVIAANLLIVSLAVPMTASAEGERKVSLTFDSQSVFESNFDVYRTESATTAGFSKVAASDYFRTDGALFQESTLPEGQSSWDAQFTALTRAVYKEKAYRNFEMSAIVMPLHVNDVYPMLMFGIQDPTQPMQYAGGGYETFIYDEGFSRLYGRFNGVWTGLGDSENHKTNGDSFYGLGQFRYRMTLRVEGKTAVLTIDTLVDWAKNYSYTYQLPDDYTGGYVGIGSTSGNSVFWDFSITDLSGDSFLSYDDDFYCGDRTAANFDIYQAAGDDAQTNGFEETDFADYFAANDQVRRLEYSNDRSDLLAAAGTDNYWTLQDKLITTAVFNQRQYRNFEMKIRTQGSGNWDVWPMLIFGITDSSKSVQQAGGGYQLGIYNEGGTFLKGIVNGAYTAANDSAKYNEISGVSGSNKFGSLGSEYNLIIRVQGNKATATVEYNGNSYSYEYKLSTDYTGGYVGFGATGRTHTFSSFSITELPEVTDTAIKVACVGDNITYGDKVTADKNYPTVLQQLVGDNYDVRNFGICALTAQTETGVSYSDNAAYTQSLSYQPDIVIIMLGTNDSWDAYWNEERFENDFTTLIDTYKNLESHPTVYVATSPTIYLDVTPNLSDYIVPMQKRIAGDAGCEIIDINSFTGNHADWFTDGVHPTESGYRLIARAFAKVIADVSIKGDGNNDWLVNANDIVVIRKALLDCCTIAEGLDMDMNNDGKFNITDLVSMKKQLARGLY